MQKLKDELGLSDTSIEIAKNIFRNYSEKLSEGVEVNWNSFENRLKTNLDIGYQAVKTIVLEFYDQNSYKDVCKGYASEHDVQEFKRINQ